MAKPRGKAKNADSLRKFRSGISKLKKAGLIDKSIDARTVKPTASLRAKLRKYDDVATGKATVVKAPSSRAAKISAKRAGFQSVGDIVIVPKHRGMRARYERGYMKASGTTFGQHISQIYIKPGEIDKLPKPKPGHYYVFKVPFAQYGDFQQFASYEAYKQFRDGYHRQKNKYHPSGSYLDMDEQVIIEEVPEDYEEGEE